MSKPLPSRVRVAGPLEPYVAGFRRELTRQGYSQSPAAGHLQLMAHLSRWLVTRGLGPEDLSVRRIEEFVSDRRASGRNHRRLTVRGVAPLLEYLRDLGVVPPEPPSPVTDGPLERLVEEFSDYLVSESGLAESTVSNYCGVPTRFLTGRSWERDENDLWGVSADEVNAFVLAEAALHSPGTLNNVTTGLRALLRFAYVEGYASSSLAGAVPTAPGWRDSGLRRSVEAGVVDRLLASCDRRTAVGRRDFAILTVLARLGLRADGAPLFEIGQALRHRRVASTALYAKDDTEALIAVARRWPGGGS